MYYLNPTSTENGNYGNPQSNAFDGALALADALLTEYISTMGFATLTAADGTITAVTLNREAYEAYVAEHPEPEEPDTEDEPTADELIDILLGVGE